MRTGDILLNLHTLDLQVQVAFDAALTETGITGAQWRVLDAAIAAPGSSSAELARICQVTPQTMQAQVAALERAGLVVRTPHQVHGRVLQIYLSNAGELRHAAGVEALSALQERLFIGLTGEERAEFGRLVAIALGAIRRD